MKHRDLIQFTHPIKERRIVFATVVSFTPDHSMVTVKDLAGLPHTFDPRFVDWKLIAEFNPNN